ncbi:caspase-4-like [Perognathus longimembris pacificus]|uniref:caspase-4-like n=1 Tax=Perognathus longimembris pacificus TaxID=214514 RepID=UPI0020186ADC|nr:caspase-4-like [Perognathus longimembris pacificus]
MAGNDLKRKPFKMIEIVGKNLLTGFLENLVQNDVVKLEEEDKEKFSNAEWRDKRWVFVDALQRNPEMARQLLTGKVLDVKPKSNVNAHPITESGPAESAEYTESLKLCSREEFLRRSTEMADEIYPIKEKTDRTRLALIICNTKYDHLSLRYGADCDIRGMQGLLEDLSYTVSVEENLSAKEMESVLRTFADRPEHSSSDSTFLVLMSHGTPNGICGITHSDEIPDVLSYDTIYQIFNNCNCRGLRDKPKVIIVQACRGGHRGGVWVRDSPAALEDCSSVSQKMEEDAVFLKHKEKDFIVFFSSTPNNMSYRDPMNGSPFITELIKCFKKYSCSCHLVQIFRKVQRSFEDPTTVTQLPSIERITLTRDFYLFPGN